MQKVERKKKVAQLLHLIPAICTGWNFYIGQACSCPRGWCLSKSWGIKFRVLLKPLEYAIIMVSRSLKRDLQLGQEPWEEEKVPVWQICDEISGEIINTIMNCWSLAFMISGITSPVFWIMFIALNILLSRNDARREIFLDSGQSKPNLECNDSFPIDLAPISNPLNLSEKGNYNSNLVWIIMIQKRFLCVYVFRFYTKKNKIYISFQIKWNIWSWW